MNVMVRVWVVWERAGKGGEGRRRCVCVLWVWEMFVRKQRRCGWRIHGPVVGLAAYIVGWKGRILV